MPLGVGKRLYLRLATWLYSHVPAAFPIPPQPIPFGDGVYWHLNADFPWTDVNGKAVVTVPKGFVTDFASTPWPSWPWMPPWGTYGNAAIVHDWLYWNQAGTRKEADEFLRAGMVAMKTTPWKACIIYRAVRLFGWVAWNQNRQLRDAGVIRVITAPVATGAETYQAYLERVQDTTVEQRLNDAKRKARWQF